jgi:hypothetical protein
MSGGPMRIVIAGGGLAAWLAAAALGRVLEPAGYPITVVGTGDGDDRLAPYGAADAALPWPERQHVALDLDDEAVVSNCAGAFSFGLALDGWNRPDGTYFHPFSQMGAPLGPVSFYHILLRLRQAGEPLRLSNFALAALAAQAGRFTRPGGDPASVLSTCRHGLHADCHRLAALYRAAAGKHGVAAVPGHLHRAELGSDGSVAALVTSDEQRIEGDLFIDGSGVAARLISSVSDSDWIDWSGWLPCDRILSADIDHDEPPPPYSLARAHAAGWLRTLPLQGRLALVNAYGTDFTDQEQALGQLRQQIVIVGGGTAGWMTAAALSQVMGRFPGLEIELVESEAIGTVGVGEATIPADHPVQRMLGLDENEFVRETHATFKLGIEFVDWGRVGDRYIHPFGFYGARHDGPRIPPLLAQGPHAAAPASSTTTRSAGRRAHESRFKMAPARDNPKSPLSQLAYAFQFDAGLYARYLRGRAEQQGVTRTEGRSSRSSARRERLRHRGRARRRRAHRRRPVHRLLGLPRAADRAGTGVASRTGATGCPATARWRALRARGSPALHPLDRARRRLAVAHPAAAPHRQRPRLQQRNHERGRGAAHPAANLDGEPLAEPQPIRFTTGTAPEVGTRTWSRSGCPAASSSRWSRPAST